MKSAIVVVLLGLALVESKVDLPQDVLDYIKELHDICLEKTGLSEVVVTSGSNMLYFAFIDEHQMFELSKRDPKIMCYMECMMLAGKWMSSDLTIQYRFIEETCPPSVRDIVMAAIAKCKNIDPGTQKCEKAYNFNECMFKADPENWYLL